MTITLNGDPLDMPDPLTVTQLLEQLHIDSRRVAVEHNFIVLKRVAYDTTLLAEGDHVGGYRGFPVS